MKAIRIVLCVIGGCVANQVYPPIVCASNVLDSFEIVAKLKNPGHKPGVSDFRCAALRFPWIYALETSTSRLTGRVFVFKMAQEVGIQDVDGVSLPTVMPFSIIDNIGDGEWLSRWGDYLLCSQRGGLEVYSTTESGELKCVARCRTRSGTAYMTSGVVRDADYAYVIGRNTLLCYDLHEPSKARCIGETAVAFRGTAGCISEGRLYVGGRKEVGQDVRNGVAVFSVDEPAQVRELGFTPLPRPVYHLFRVSDRLLLASTDAEDLTYSFVSPTRSPSGNAALLDISEASHPLLVAEIGQSGARSATLLSSGKEVYYICEAAVFVLRDCHLEKIYAFWDCGTTLSGAPYYGDSDGKYAVLPNDEAVVLLKRVPR